MLTCPIIFKTVEEMEDHHGQRVEGEECNVHLDLKQIIEDWESSQTIEDTVKNNLPHSDSPSPLY